MWLDNTEGGEFEVPIGATVKFSDTGQIQLEDDEGNDHWVSSKNASKIKIMHPSSAAGVEDMVQQKRITVLRNFDISFLLLLNFRFDLEIFTRLGCCTTCSSDTRTRRSM